MSDNRDEKLESMLWSRRVEAANPALADKIILSTRWIPQIESVSLWRMLRDLCTEFHLPKPAYVFAGALALGIVVGLHTPEDRPTTPDARAMTMQGFLAADEGLL